MSLPYHRRKADKSLHLTDKSLHLLKLFTFVVEFTSYLNNLKSQEKFCKLIVNSKDKILGTNLDIVRIAIRNDKNSKTISNFDFNLQVTLGKTDEKD